MCIIHSTLKPDNLTVLGNRCSDKDFLSNIHTRQPTALHTAYIQRSVSLKLDYNESETVMAKIFGHGP